MDEILIDLQQGLIRGKLSKNYKNDSFYSFYGIPYAKIPEGNLRFKAPQPPESWKGILDATKEKDGCISKNIYTRNIEGSEDCLHLNVYTPELNTTRSSYLRPVMVFVHGNSFIAGNNKTELYGSEFLLTQDIVLVTVCYRLGAFGFSYLQDQSLGVTGNQGIKDVIMSLKWVQKNITSFCGDPDNVTLFGSSSGAGIAHHIMLSSNKGLFHKIILHSGCCLCCWATSRKDSLKQLGKELEFDGDDEKELLEFLLKKSVWDIYQGQRKALLKTILTPNNPRYFFPIIEDESNESVIREDPWLIIEKGNYLKMPILMGYTSDECLFKENEMKKMVKENSELVYDMEDLIPYTFNLQRGSFESKQIAELIKEFYCGNKKFQEIGMEKYLQANADVCCIFPIQAAIKKHFNSQTFPIYFYKFAFEGKLNLYKKLQGVTSPGASHNDDLCYLFKMSKNPDVIENSIEDVMIQRMVKFWTNFAKFGNPNGQEEKVDELINVKWKPVEKNKMNYLCIDNVLSTGVNSDEDRVQFWEGLYNKWHKKY